MSRVVRIMQASSQWGNRWATCILILLLPLSVYWPIGPSVAPWTVDAYARPGLYLSDLAIGLLLLTTLTGLGSCSARWGHPYLLPLLALVGLAALTLPFSFLPTLAGYTTVRWLLAIGAYTGLVRSRLPVDRLVTVFLAGLALHAVIGLGQILKHGPLGLPGELALEPWQRDVAIIKVAGTAGIPAYGLTFNPNVLGGFLAVGLLLGLPLLAQRGLRIMWWLAWMGLLLTFSRSAWLATALLMPLAAGWLARKRPSLRRPLVIGAAGAMLIGSVVGIIWNEQMRVSWYPITAPIESVMDRAVPFIVKVLEATTSLVRPSQLPTSSEDYLQAQPPAAEQVQAETDASIEVDSTISLAHRIELWKVALGIIEARPLTGIGAGNYPVTVPFVSEGLRPNHAHNVPLQLAAEIGVIGGGVWLWMWLGSAATLFRRRLTLHSWAVVSICAWLALGLISLYDGYPWVIDSGRLLTVAVLSLASRTMDRGLD